MFKDFEAGGRSRPTKPQRGLAYPSNTNIVRAPYTCTKGVAKEYKTQFKLRVITCYTNASQIIYITSYLDLIQS